MKRLLKIFPFNTARCSIRQIRYEDISWYVNIIKQPFFNEYVDGKSSDTPDAVLTGKLIGLISTHKLGISCKNEIRAVISIGTKMVGGITIFHTEEPDIYDIGYWVITEFQSQGIASEVLMGLTNKLEFNVKGLKALRLIVRIDNDKSVRIANKAGYKYTKSIQGKEKENLVYEYEPLKFS